MLRISPDLNVVVSILESGDLLDKDFIYLNLATTKKKVQTDTLVTAEWMFFLAKIQESQITMLVPSWSQTPPSLEGIGPPKKQFNQLLGMSFKRQQSCVKKTTMTSFISTCIECILLIFIFHDVGSSCRTLFHPIFINLIYQAQIDLGARCDPANLRIRESWGQKTAAFLGTKISGKYHSKNNKMTWIRWIVSAKKYTEIIFISQTIYYKKYQTY